MELLTVSYTVSISNSDSKNDELQRTLNMITMNQAMSLLQNVWWFVESVEGLDTYVFEAKEKLKDFINKQPKK